MLLPRPTQLAKMASKETLNTHRHRTKQTLLSHQVLVGINILRYGAVFIQEWSKETDNTFADCVKGDEGEEDVF